MIKRAQKSARGRTRGVELEEREREIILSSRELKVISRIMRLFATSTEVKFMEEFRGEALSLSLFLSLSRKQPETLRGYGYGYGIGSKRGERERERRARERRNEGEC